MSAIVARIILRYAAGALLSAGYLSPDVASTLGTDPDVLMLLGAGLGIVAEGAYALAHKFGWAR